MELSQTTIGFIGAGNMGQSMIHGLLSQTPQPKHLLVCDHHPESLETLIEGHPVSLIQDPFKLACEADVVVLAVKPQNMGEVLKAIKGFDAHNTPILVSIAAGITTAQLLKPLGLKADYPLIRVMPNTPALIQLGASGLYANTKLTQDKKALSESIASAIGEWVWIDDESHMDIVTALSGSGPAYFFMFMEELIKSAVQLGLPEKAARQLCLATAQGSVNMALKSHDTLEQLRKKVTSKGGTTEAALNSLTHDKLDTILFRALSKATQRGKELSKSLESIEP